VRRIWLCADDYGLAPGVNAAIRDLIARRRINATSVMTVAPHMTREAADALAALNTPEARASLGLHLTFTAPFRPLTSVRPTATGGFPKVAHLLARTTLRRFAPAQLTAEVEAQLAAFVTLFGKPPDFIDGHQHVHLFPQLRDAVLDAAARLAPAAWVRQCGRAAARPAWPRDPKTLLLDALSRSFRRRAARRGIATNPAFAGAYVFSRTADFAELFPKFLEGLPDGGLVMCHPGFVDAELERLDPLTHLREREHVYLAGDRFPAVLAQAGVALR
jgi:predicted glycoside hydrolase/deacetylase ChbG (UPF0249 family)